MDSNCSTSNKLQLLFFAYSVTASDNGCSEACSIDAAACNNQNGSTPSCAIISVTTGFPSVTVPVLSNTTVCTSCAISKLSADLIRIPFSAPFPVPTIMAVGVANPNAHGQEMTSTAIPMDNANAKEYPAINQMTADTTAIVITTGTKIPLTLSANLAIGALELPASSTNCTI